MVVGSEMENLVFFVARVSKNGHADEEFLVKPWFNDLVLYFSEHVILSEPRSGFFWVLEDVIVKGDLKNGLMVISHVKHCKILLVYFLPLEALVCIDQTRQVVMKGMHFIGVYI